MSLPGLLLLTDYSALCSTCLRSVFISLTPEKPGPRGRPRDGNYCMLLRLTLISILIEAFPASAQAQARVLLLRMLWRLQQHQVLLNDLHATHSFSSGLPWRRMTRLTSTLKWTISGFSCCAVKPRCKCPVVEWSLAEAGRVVYWNLISRYDYWITAFISNWCSAWGCWSWFGVVFLVLSGKLICNMESVWFEYVAAFENISLVLHS